MSMNGNVGGVDKVINKAWCNISTVWKEIQKGWANIGGVWKVFYEAAWYLYNLGVEAVAFVEGYSSGGVGSFTKYPTYMQMSCTYNTGTLQRACVTANPVDLTPYSKAYIEWADVSTSSGAPSCRFVIATSKLGSYSTDVVASLIHSGHFPQQVEFIDISALTGSYYLRAHGISAVSNSNVKLQVYKIWLE